MKERNMGGGLYGGNIGAWIDHEVKKTPLPAFVLWDVLSINNALFLGKEVNPL